MGFFDTLTNLSPEQNAGLIGLGAQLLSNDGRSPPNWGAAIQAGQQGEQQYAEHQRAKQMLAMQAKLMGYKLQDAESDFKNQEQARERNARIVKRLQGLPDLPQLSEARPQENGGTPDVWSSPSPFMRQMAAMGDSAPLAGQFGDQGAPPEQMQGAQQRGGQQLPFLPPTMRQGGAAPRLNLTQAYVQRLMEQADVYATEGDFEGANKRYEAALKFQPEVGSIDIAADPQTGQPIRVIRYKDGREEASQFGPKPDMVGVDLGGTYEFVDKNRVQSGRVFQKTQTPNSRADDIRFAARRGAGAGGAEPSMNDETLDFLSDRALRGDRTALQNLGRGAQGAANLVALNQRITEKAKVMGLTGADLASINADYDGQKAGLRTSGTISARIENAAAEAQQLAPLALSASEKVARSGLLPFGKAEIMFNKNTNNPALNEFATANIGLATAYAGAMARGGKATVSDMEHAREILSTAKNHTAYKATVGQLQLEIEAAMRAPQHVRENLRGQISGRSGGHDTPKVPNPMAPSGSQRFDMLPPAAKYDGKRMKADNGTIYVSRSGKWVKE